MVCNITFSGKDKLKSRQIDVPTKRVCVSTFASQLGFAGTLARELPVSLGWLMAEEGLSKGAICVSAINISAILKRAVNEISLVRASKAPHKHNLLQDDRHKCLIIALETGVLCIMCMLWMFEKLSKKSTDKQCSRIFVEAVMKEGPWQMLPSQKGPCAWLPLKLKRHNRVKATTPTKD